MQETTTNEAQINEKFDYDLLVELTRKLTDIVKQEAALLREMKISAIKEFQSSKHHISLALEKQQNIIRQDETVRKALTEKQKETLRLIASEFDESLQDYQRELFKAQRINQIIIGKMMEALKEHVEKDKSYNKLGARSLSGIELAKNTPAIKFNQQI